MQETISIERKYFIFRFYILFLALLIDALSERWLVVIASVCPAGGVPLLLEQKKIIIKTSM